MRGVGLVAVILTHLAVAVLVARGIPVRAEQSPVELNQHFGSASESLLLAGGVGLSIFFCLSGYLIARPFIRAYLGGRPMPPLGPYAANRLLRIVPAMWLAATVYLVVFNRTGQPLEQIAAVYFFVQTYIPDPGTFVTSIGHAWSIDVELTFYLLIPVAAFAMTRLTPRRMGFWGRLALLLGLVGLVTAGSFALQWETPDSSVAIHTLPLVLVSFLPGVALAAVEPVALPALRGKGWARWLALAVLGAGLMTFVVLADSADFMGRPETVGTLRRLAENLVVVFGPGVLMAAALIQQWAGRPCPRALDNAVFRWLGERSYSLYLFHMVPVLAFTDELVQLADDMGVWPMLGVAMVVELAILVPLGELSYRFVERPFLSLKRRRRSVSLRPVPASAEAG
jgi:peptidoglycan/LPS O-acetylase OafA/YrhL